MTVLETPRLILRLWRDSDRAPFAQMCADPHVMRHFASTLTREECDRMIDRNLAHFDRHGFGLWAAELRATGSFIGFIGLSVPGFQARFMPCVEIGWRIAAPYWNQGLATEGARAVLRYAFDTLGLSEVVSFTVPDNLPSRRVMEKLGLTHHDADDFDHPNLPEGHPQRRHVLYRIRKECIPASIPVVLSGGGPE
jgi:RimJ/RimL family protein N-acetyltransferase